MGHQWKMNFLYERFVFICSVFYFSMAAWSPYCFIWLKQRAHRPECIVLDQEKVWMRLVQEWSITDQWRHVQWTRTRLQVWGFAWFFPRSFYRTLGNREWGICCNQHYPKQIAINCYWREYRRCGDWRWDSKRIISSLQPVESKGRLKRGESL